MNRDSNRLENLEHWLQILEDDNENPLTKLQNAMWENTQLWDQIEDL